MSLNLKRFIYFLNKKSYEATYQLIIKIELWK